MEGLVPRGLAPGQSSLQGVWWKLWIWISWFAYPSCAGRWLFLPLRINSFGRNHSRSARPKFWASIWQKIMNEFMSSCYIHLRVCLSAPLLPWFRLCRIPNHAPTQLLTAVLSRWPPPPHTFWHLSEDCLENRSCLLPCVLSTLFHVSLLHLSLGKQSWNAVYRPILVFLLVVLFAYSFWYSSNTVRVSSGHFIYPQGTWTFYVCLFSILSPRQPPASLQ